MYQSIIKAALLGVLILLPGPALGLVIRVDSGDEMALIEAINRANADPDNSILNEAIIEIVPTGEDFVFDGPIEGTDTALPVITSHISIFESQFDDQMTTFRPAMGRTHDFRLFKIGGEGALSLINVTVRDFGAPAFPEGNGGAILVDGPSASLEVAGCRFENNSAGNKGGAISRIDGSQLKVRHCEFVRNGAAFGGAIDIGGMFRGGDLAIIRDSTFEDNIAVVFGCDLNISAMTAEGLGNRIGVTGSSFDGVCPNVRVEHPSAGAWFRGNTFGGEGEAIDATDQTELFSNTFDMTSSNGGNKRLSSGSKATCNDFGSNAFQSLGYNINRDDACDLDQATDLPDTDPMTVPGGADGVVALAPESPAIDSGADTLVEVGDNRPTAPCGYRDIRGLGRPQDANGDGEFECDRGAYEMQGGPDIGAPASGAFFDVSRDGEGVFLEILPDSRAVIGFFTHNTSGTGAAWYVGLGQVVGNSVVFDEMQAVTGGAFGPAFDAGAIVRTHVGGLSLVFPNCALTDSSGRMTFQALLDSELEDLLSGLDRLSFIVPCTGSPAPTAGRSGEFFDPARDGEGIFVQWLPDGRVQLIWYTFDPEGNPLWIISGDSNVNGDTVTFEMLYPVGFTRFGSGFDPDEVELAPWGTATLTYGPGCDEVTFAFEPSVAGFQADSYDYTRLTTLAGTSCDL